MSNENDSKIAVAADLAPIKRALRKLHERSPVVYSSAAMASLHDQLSPAEELCATAMTVSRRLDFIGGRLAAKQALGDAGYAANVSLTADRQGVPLFPEGYCGSIAHKHGRAVATVASSALVQGIGIDLEYDADHDDDSLVAGVITEAELPCLDAIRATEPFIRSPATLVLAAKEALYKAVFPVSRLKFDFDEVEIFFVPEFRSFRAVRFPGDQRLEVEGRYELDGRWFVAVALVIR